MILNRNDVNYIKAYTEVNCLLDYLPKSYIDKIPNKLIELIKNQSDKKYYIAIDKNKSLLEQNFSSKTKDLIAVIKYNYWSNNEEKERLKKLFCENEYKYQKDQEKKYNTNNIFNRKETNIIKNLETEKKIIKYKENIFKRILTKIKNIFKYKF